MDIDSPPHRAELVVHDPVKRRGVCLVRWHMQLKHKAWAVIRRAAPSADCKLSTLLRRVPSEVPSHCFWHAQKHLTGMGVLEAMAKVLLFLIPMSAVPPRKLHRSISSSKPYRCATQTA